MEGQEYKDYPFLIASALKALDEQKSEISDALQNMARSEKLFESHYFRNKLKGTLEDANLTMQKSAKLIRDLSLDKDDLEQSLKKMERRVENLEDQVLQGKRAAEEKGMQCNKLKEEMLKEEVAVNSLESKLKYLNLEVQEKDGELRALREEVDMLRKKEEILDSNREEFGNVVKERDALKEELKEVTENYIEAKSLLQETQGTVPKGAATVLQVQKNKEIVNETNSILESAQQNLSNLRESHNEPEDEKPEPGFSKTAEQELERQCTFIRKAMRELSSQTSNSLLQVFGSPDALAQLISEKDYESLLVLLLKMVSNMLVTEHSESREERQQIKNGSPSTLKYEELKTVPPTEPKQQKSLLRNSIEEYINAESVPKSQPPMDKSQETMGYPMPEMIQAENEKVSPERGRRMSPQGHHSNSAFKELQKKRKLLAVYRGDSKQDNINREGSAKFEKWLRSYEENVENSKPVFNNYTKRTTEYFDPFLQFGGESILTSTAAVKSFQSYTSPKSRLLTSTAFHKEPSNRIMNEKLMKMSNTFRDRPSWRDARQFFIENGSESPTNRLPSPDKITTPPKGSYGAF